MDSIKAFFGRTDWRLWVGAGAAVTVILVVAINANKSKDWVKRCEANFGTLSEVQKRSIRLIVQAFKEWGDGDDNKLAYILATAWHECSFEPKREYRAKPSQVDVYLKQNRYWYTGFFGRGFVQLTWERNYLKMSKITGVDLVKNPDLALNPAIAAKIIVYGMINGSFTRKPLSKYINYFSVDFYRARLVVNGYDKAAIIANYAKGLIA